MVDTTTQIACIGGAALASMFLALVWVMLRSRRRNARQRQAEQETAYDAAVVGYRAAVETGLRRRAQLVELLEVTFAGRSDRALTSAGSAAIDSSVSRLYLDLALAGDDHLRREGILGVVRRGISDIEILMPEAPLPPAPVARLGRRARRSASQWQAARAAELEPLRALLVDPAFEGPVESPVESTVESTVDDARDTATDTTAHHAVGTDALQAAPVPVQKIVAQQQVGSELAVAS